MAEGQAAAPLIAGSSSELTAWFLLFSRFVQERCSAWVCALIVTLVSVSGCSSQHQHLQHQQEKLESLGSTTAAIGEAWLAGHASGTYTLTALEQTQRLVEQARTAVASAPPALADPRGARLSQAAERLSRLIVDMMQDVREADGDSVRQHLGAIPIAPARP